MTQQTVELVRCFLGFKMIAELFRYFGFSQSLQDENDHLLAMLRERENTIDCMASAYRDKEKELKKVREECEVFVAKVRSLS